MPVKFFLCSKTLYNVEGDEKFTKGKVYKSYTSIDYQKGGVSISGQEILNNDGTPHTIMEWAQFFSCITKSSTK